MNSTDIFAIALGLVAPWELKKVEFSTTLKARKELHIYIGVLSGSKFKDESGIDCSLYDSKARTWRHLNFFEHECYLHCDVPRIATSVGKVMQVRVPWARGESGFTLLFEAFAMHLIECEMPVSKVGETMAEYPNRVWRIFHHWIKLAYKESDHSGVKKLGIDETSTKRGHHYISVGVDLETKAVVHAVVGKDAQCVKSIKDYLESKGTKSAQIEQVSIDLSPAFIAGVSDNFEKAAITFDRFHIKKLLNKAMDEVRKAEKQAHQLLKGQRYLFLKGNSKLSQQQRDDREKYITLLPVLGQAYRLKELFDDFWEMKDVEEASGFLMYWTELAKESTIQPMIKFANTIKSHWSGIINYIKTHISNGILEGINSKIQLAKKRARGYRNITNFINMIYFIAGKLKFNYPLQTT